MRRALTAVAGAAGLALGTLTGAVPAAGVPAGGPIAPVMPVPLAAPANPIVPAASAGYLPDSWQVSPGGSFADTVALDVPAGRAGMAPGLALGYDSNGTDGLLGMGWTLTGATSRITRCGQTPDTEGTLRGVRYDTGDRYCIDGQKLIAVGAVDYGSGDYGGIDTQYRTETDQYAQIISVGSDQTIASGPDAFKVRTSGGLILTYLPQTGTRTVSGVGLSGGLVEATQSTSTPRVVWLLSSETDRSGNEIRYTYTGDFANGDYRPDRITYTYNAGVLQGQRYVQFTYENRPDAQVGYQNGVRYSLPKRLKSIAMYAPDPGATAQVWRYDLTYQTSSTNRSLLTSVSKCAPSGACLAAKQFTWNNPGVLPWFIQSFAGQANVVAGTRAPALSVFDINGDGLDDTLFALGGNDDASDPVMLRTGLRNNVGTVQPLAVLNTLTGNGLPANTALAASRALDLKGDGTTELDAKWSDANGWHDSVYSWDSAAQKLVSTGITIGTGSTSDFADLNGDGLVDLIGTGSVQLNQNGSFGAANPVTPSSTCGRRIGDFDGDGRTDIVLLPQQNRACGTAASLSTVDDTGKVSAAPASFVSGGVTYYDWAPGNLAGYTLRSGDFNGDGLADTLALPTDPAQPARILWNTGAGAHLDPHTIAVPRDAFNDVRVADVNADGRADLVALGSVTTVLVSLGDGTFASGVVANDTGYVDPKFGRTTTQLGDFNGDGRVDLLRIVNNTWTLLSQGAVIGVDRLATVKDAGTPWTATTVGYDTAWTDHAEKLTDYTCAYPLVCVRHGVVVVRKVDSAAHNVNVPAAGATVRSTYYSYEDPVADMRGRGFLGFGTFRVWDPARPVETITTYDHRGTLDGKYYPFAGRPWTVTTVVPILTAVQTANKVTTATARVVEQNYTWTQDKPNNGKTYAVNLSADWTKRWEQPVTVDWAALGGPQGNPHTVHVLAVAEPQQVAVQVNDFYTTDGYGNTTHATTQVVGGTTHTVDTTVDNRVDDWLIGLPTAVAATAGEADNKPAAVTRHLGYHYDDLGRLDSTTVEPGNPDPSLTSSTAYAFDGYGVVRKVTRSGAGQPDRVMHLEYGPLFPGQPDEEVYPSQTWFDHDPVAYRPTEWTMVHPAYGVTVATEDANGRVDTAQYDEFGRPVSVNPKGQAATTLSYAPRPDSGGTNGMVVTASSAGNTAKTFSGSAGQTIGTAATGFDGQLDYTDYGFDMLGRQVTGSRPHPAGGATATVTTAYDSLDRVLSVAQPNSATQTYSYTFFTTHANGGNNVTSDTTSDVDGRTTGVTRYDISLLNGVTPVHTSYTYAPFDLMDTVTDDKGNVTSFGYDALGRRTTMVDPDRGAVTDTYLPTGEMHSEDHAGVATTYAYDDLGRRVSAASPDGITSYTWDASAYGIGQMSEATSPDGIVTRFRYDNAGRVDSVDYVDTADNNATYTMEREYNANGQLTSLSYPDGSGQSRFSLGYGYNASGYLATISRTAPGGGAGATIWQVQSRNPDGTLATGVLGASGQIGVGYGQDAKTGQLTGIAAAVGGKAIMNIGYGYYDNGLVHTRSDLVAGRTETYGYDTLDRLATWTLQVGKQPSTTTTYGYDSIGDLTHVSGGQNAVDDKRTFGGPNGTVPHQLTTRDATVGGGTVNSYGYDPQGRLTQTKDPNDTVTQQIAYTSFDLPHTVTQGGQTWTFGYDAFGRRVKKSGPDGVTFSVPGAYDKTTTASGTQYVYHVQGTDGPVAEVRSDGTTTRVLYELTDRLGSVSALVDESGTMNQSLYYDPFGNRINADGTRFTGTTGWVSGGYTGQSHDDDLGLIDMKGRVYNPDTEQFTSGDPVVANPYAGLSWNPYSYVLNNPVNLTDPTGLIYSNCGNAPYLPECDPGMGGGFGSSGGSGGSGGYDDSAFNPNFGDEDGGWHAREIQRDFAEFAHAAEAYEAGGAHGLAGYEKGDLARAVRGLESEWGPGGYMAQAAALHAKQSDGEGVHTNYATINDDQVECHSNGEDCHHGKSTDDGSTEDGQPKVEGGMCSDWEQLSGTSLSVMVCTTRTSAGYTGTVYWQNNGEQVDNVSIRVLNPLTEEEMYSAHEMGGPIVTTCVGDTIAAGEVASCGSASYAQADGLNRPVYYAEVSYWNPLTEQFTTQAVGYWNRKRFGGDWPSD